jgi:hypothetical protein
MHYGAFLAKFNRIVFNRTWPPGRDGSVTSGGDRYWYDRGGLATWDAQADVKGLDAQGPLPPLR